MVLEMAPRFALSIVRLAAIPRCSARPGPWSRSRGALIPVLLLAASAAAALVVTRSLVPVPALAFINFAAGPGLSCSPSVRWIGAPLCPLSLLRPQQQDSRGQWWTTMRAGTKEEAALDTLAASALTRETPAEEVFEAIRTLEKAKNRLGESGFEPLLTGDWRLIYTTGTKKTEDDIGRVNYVPITAVQRFDMEKRFIRNGVYLGPISIEFEGALRWIEERRRLEFDFEDLKFCGISVPLPDWLRSQAGMKSETPYKKQPAFEFVAVDERVAAARGAGGGVALWLRNELVDQR